jgi:hypothetical protein
MVPNGGAKCRSSPSNPEPCFSRACPIAAVAIEPVDPSQVMGLIQSGSIKFPVREVASTASGAPQTLLFDDRTGALMLAVNEANPSGTAPSLLIDSLGEEWLLVPAAGGATPASLVQLSGALSTRNGW